MTGGLFEGELKKRLPTVLGEVMDLLRKPSDKVEDIREKEALYERILTLLQPFKEIANVWVAADFGNPVTAKDYTDLIAETRRAGQALAPESTRPPWIVAAQGFANEPERSFFHWELEFPEVFFEETGQRKRNPGFDAAIGNPPYVRQEQIKGNKDYFQHAFQVYDGVADLYVYFYEIGHRLLREGGRFGMITSNKFMRAAYGERLRKFLFDKAKPLQIIDFGDLPVFPDASAYPCIVLTIKGGETALPTHYLRVASLDFDSLDALVRDKGALLPAGALSKVSWQLADADEMAILAKMEAVSVSLKKWLGDDKINYGIKTGYNEAFFIDEETRAWLVGDDPKSAELIKPLVVGEDIKRYEIEYRNRYLIWTYVGVPIGRYPAIRAYLERFRDRLEKRSDKGQHWWELRPCDYYADFAKPKIVYPVIARDNTFAYETAGALSNDKTFIIPTDSHYCLAVLNSSLGFLWARSALSWLRGGFLEYRAQSMVLFPVHRIAFVTPQAERERMVEEAKRLYREALERLGPGNSPEKHRKGDQNDHEGCDSGDLLDSVQSSPQGGAGGDRCSPAWGQGIRRGFDGHRPHRTGTL